MDALTYDDIYELLRSEKNNTDLQPLSEEMLAKISSYLDAKKALLNQQPQSVFSGVKERAKIVTEIENAKQALRDLFEKRERKVISRAVYTVRTESKIKDTANMLASEEELYGALLKLLSQDRKRFFSALEQAKSIEKDAVSEGDSEIPEAGELAKQLKKIKIGEDIPELASSDLKMYGPYKAGSEASLPEELANLLVKRGKAELV